MHYHFICNGQDITKRFYITARGLDGNELFSELITSRVEEHKIKWLGNSNQIMYLIDKLKNDLIKVLKDHMFSLIEKHFLNNENKPFKNTQLSSDFWGALQCAE